MSVSEVTTNGRGARPGPLDGNGRERKRQRRLRQRERNYQLAPPVPDDAPLVLRGPYCPRIDAAGGGATARSVSRRKNICNYLLTAFWDDDFEIRCENEVRVLKRRGLFLITPDRPFRVTMQGGGRIRWAHFSVRWDQAWEAFDHQVDFNIDRGRDAFVQPAPERVWGVDLSPWAPSGQSGRMLTLMADMVELWLDGEIGSRIDANLLLGQLLNTWVRQVRSSRQSPTKGDVLNRVIKAERYARRRNGVDVSVAQMAQAAGYTRSHFSAIYQRQRGEGPGHFLRRLRLREAATILRTQDVPVRVVGELVGYPNPSAFARTFRQHFGCSPEHFRQDH